MLPNHLDKIDFQNRRKALYPKIRGGVLFLPSASQQLRNGDVHFSFRQESNFYYLTGHDEPQSMALFNPQSKTPFQLFVPPRDKTKEMWDGPILGPERAKTLLGADAAHPSNQWELFEEKFIEALLESESLYYRVGLSPDWDQKVFQTLYKAARKQGRTGRNLWPILDPVEVLGEMRLFKSKAEQERLQVAGHISSEAHAHVMRTTKPGMFEYEVEAALFHSFRALGAKRLGYDSIVASGPNACVLHYQSNSRQMQNGELLLVDAGAEFDYYTADITRTFPISGRFTESQRDIYAAVLKVQKECIALVKPGRLYSDIHDHAVESLTEEMKRLKLLKGPTAQLIKKLDYKTYYPHGTGHWLGMDVHDVGKYIVNGNANKQRKLEPGMVLTVEPGLYFGLSGPGPAKYKGIGVRIEDDVLVTHNGHKVLTAEVPKEIDEVESLCANA